MNAITMLERDHDKVKRLLARLGATTARAPITRRKLFTRIRSRPHLPDLSGLERPRMDLPEAVSNFEWPEIDLPEIDLPEIDLPSVDIRKAIAGAAAAAHIRRQARRPRWPLAVAALVAAGLAGWVILSQDAQRVRLNRGVRAIRERISAIRSGLRGRSEIAPDDAVAFTAAETAPIETSPFTDAATVQATDYPAGLGSNDSDVTPVMEEVSSPA